jgi:hypothetical protein
LLIVPVVRFGPRYVQMARGVAWGDIALDVDSQQVASQINAIKRPGDTLLVWGYRPDVYVYTRLSPEGRFWDSQPLTGVAADRHLTAQEPVDNAATANHLAEVLHSRPTFVVDGLGLLNAKMKPTNFVDMRSLLNHYREVGRTRLSVIYRRSD